MHEPEAGARYVRPPRGMEDTGALLGGARSDKSSAAATTPRSRSAAHGDRSMHSVPPSKYRVVGNAMPQEARRADAHSSAQSLGGLDTATDVEAPSQPLRHLPELPGSASEPAPPSSTSARSEHDMIGRSSKSMYTLQQPRVLSPLARRMSTLLADEAMRVPLQQQPQGKSLGLLGYLRAKRVASKLENVARIHETVWSNTDAPAADKGLVPLPECMLAIRNVNSVAHLMHSNVRWFDAKQVAGHSTADDCWITYEGIVYDMTSYLASHKRVKNEQLEALVRFAGTDISNWRVDPRDPGSSLMCPNTHEQAPSEWWLCRKKLRVGRLHCPRTGKQLWQVVRHKRAFLLFYHKAKADIHSLYGTRTEPHEIAPDGSSRPRKSTMRIAEEKIESLCCYINPDSGFRRNWDIIQVFMLAYVAVVVPYRIGFTKAIEVFTLTFMFEACVDIYFIVDMALNFRTGYLDHHRNLVVEPRLIAYNYLRGWFAIDLIACMPIHYALLLMNTGESDAAKNLRGSKILRLMRLAKLLRLARLRVLFQRYEDTVLADFVTGSKILVYILAFVYITHTLACLWHFIGARPGEAGRRGWVQKMAPNSTDWHMYLTAYHAVNPKMSDVGYGGTPDLYAQTNDEVIFAIFTELGMGLVFGLLAGTMSSIITTAKVSEQLYKSKMNELVEFLRTKRCPHAMRRSIRNYYEHLYENKTVFDEQKILKGLPPAMRTQLVHFMYKSIIETCMLFRSLDDDVISKLCTLLQPYPAPAGSSIISEGDKGTEMYIIVEGTVHITKLGKSMGILSQGGFFGEMSIIKAVVDMPSTHDRTAMSEVHSDLCFLSRDDAVELMLEYPAFKVHLMKFVVKRLKHERSNDAAIRHLTHKQGFAKRFLKKTSVGNKSEGAARESSHQDNELRHLVQEEIEAEAELETQDGERPDTAGPLPTIAGSPRIRRNQLQSLSFGARRASVSITDAKLKRHLSGVGIPSDINSRAEERAEKMEQRMTRMEDSLNTMRENLSALCEHIMPAASDGPSKFGGSAALGASLNEI